MLVSPTAPTAPRMSLTERQQRALRKAFALGLQADVVRVRFGLYLVPSTSRDGVDHKVAVSPRGQYACSCEAGVAGRPCVHAAAVYLAKLERNSGASVVYVKPAPAL
jgi:hypothetical protein